MLLLLPFSRWNKDTERLDNISMAAQVVYGRARTGTQVDAGSSHTLCAILIQACWVFETHKQTGGASYRPDSRGLNKASFRDHGVADHHVVTLGCRGSIPDMEGSEDDRKLTELSLHSCWVFLLYCMGLRVYPRPADTSLPGLEWQARFCCRPFASYFPLSDVMETSLSI